MGKEELEEKEMKEKLNIMRALTDEELDDYKTISSRSKHEICAITGCRMSDINQLIIQFETFVSIHSWVHRTKENGEPIPKSQQELFDRYKTNPVFPESVLKKRNRNIKFSKQQREKFMKYGASAIDV